jgi:hypothetical protein
LRSQLERNPSTDPAVVQFVDEMRPKLREAHRDLQRM